MLRARKNPGEFLEYRRLERMPRFMPGVTTLLGSAIEFTDAPSLIAAHQEIFRDRSYEFRPSSESPFIIDCGANIGLSVIFFKMLCPHARLLAFEPDPQLFAVLSRNVAGLGLGSVELRRAAIWTADGDATFAAEGAHSGRLAQQSTAFPMLRVPTVRLRNLLEQQVDFLKIDVEGAECAVLDDCAGALDRVETMFIEYHSDVAQPQKLDRLLRTLSEAGFRYQLRQAFGSRHPYVDRPLLCGMDLQLDIHAYRETGR